MQVVNILIIRYSSDFIPSYPHVFPKPITHITSHLTLSLGDEIDSRSDLVSTAIAGTNTKPGGKVEKDSFSNQVNHRSWECTYPWTRLYV
jgi:hypothetical protein